MLKVDNLNKCFGRVNAVKGISFAVGKGEVLGILGPNGAGKSTTAQMLAGVIPPTSGTVSICGHDIFKDPVAAKTDLGYLAEGAPCYGEMTVAEFLAYAARMRGLRGAAARARVEGAIERTGLTAVARQVIATLSRDCRQLACLAQAILHDPQVLVLDEPADGLDPDQRFAVHAIVREMSAEKAVVISTRDLGEAEAVCTRALVIAHGETKAEGTPDELRAMDPNGSLETAFRNLTTGKEGK